MTGRAISLGLAAIALVVVFSLSGVALTVANNSTLFAEWRLDEGNGTLAHDSTFLHNDGALSNASWVPGVSGSALAFTGQADSFVEVPDAPALTPITRLNIDVWIKPASLPAGFMAVMYKEDGLSQTGCFGERSYSLWVRSDGAVEFNATPEGSTCQLFFTTPTIIQSNVWSHLVVDLNTVDGTLTISHNGATVLAAAFPTQPIRAGNSPLRIGGMFQSLSDQANFNGVIDEVRISGLNNAVYDTDQDGCPDKAESSTVPGSELTGGLRAATNPYDYFNPTHDGQNRVVDILAVVDQYFIDQGSPNYRLDTDRTLVGPNAWNLGPPERPAAR